jgi:transcriptional regulator with XRE-family HTH domain
LPVRTTTSAARAARESVGLTLEAAARRARVTPDYLRRVERHGASYVLARRLAALYNCPIDAFLPKPGGGRPRAGRSRTLPALPEVGR